MSDQGTDRGSTAAQRPARPQGNDPPRLSQGGPLRVPGSDRTAQPVAPGCLLQLATTVWGMLYAAAPFVLVALAGL
jgi:hypothetical protein